MSDAPETIPQSDGHWVGRACWCGPRLIRTCPECRDDAARRPACRVCGGTGEVECHADDPDALVVVHVDFHPPVGDRADVTPIPHRPNDQQVYPVHGTPYGPVPATPEETTWRLICPFWNDDDPYTDRDRVMFGAGYEFAEIVRHCRHDPGRLDRPVSRENESRIRMAMGRFRRRGSCLPMDPARDPEQAWSDLVIEPLEDV